MESEHTTPVPRDLENQWCVVTGGTKGIGNAIARRFVDAGAHVMIAARNEADLETAVTELKSRAGAGQTIVGQQLDVSDRSSVETMFERVDELGQLNVFVANAGTGSIVPFLELDADVWDQTIGLNLTGTFTCIQGAARRMVEHGQGNRCVIAVSSVRGLGGRPGTAHYATSKAGLNQLMRVAAYELAPHQVRMNILSPGITMTPLAAVNAEVSKRVAEQVPLGRAAEAEEIAAGAHYLASPSAGFVTGANLVIDGGDTLW